MTRTTFDRSRRRMVAVGRHRRRPSRGAAAAPADQSQLRHQIYLMEGALARAVTSGAARLNQEFRAVMPDMIVLAGESKARGFHLDGYGVFFDVEVPVLRQSMMWSLRTMLDQDDQGAADALAVAAPLRRDDERPRARHGTKRRCAGSKRSCGRFGAPRRRGRRPRHARRPAAGEHAGQRAGPPGPAPRKPVNPQLLDDPNKAYTDAVVQALIDAMVDYSLPMVSSLQPDEYLTVAARDNERRDLLAPPNPYEAGVDLHACASRQRPGRVPRRQDRPRRGQKRVQVQEF